MIHDSPPKIMTTILSADARGFRPGDRRHGQKSDGQRQLTHADAHAHRDGMAACSTEGSCAFLNSMHRAVSPGTPHRTRDCPAQLLHRSRRHKLSIAQRLQCRSCIGAEISFCG